MDRGTGHTPDSYTKGGRVIRKDYETPDWLFELFHERFEFTVDAAAHNGNAKLPRFWAAADDGLSQDWRGERVWCNPPYGRGIEHWLEKARETPDCLAVPLCRRSLRDCVHRGARAFYDTG